MIIIYQFTDVLFGMQESVNVAGFIWIFPK